MMPLQRACDAESQVRNKLSNGPLRVQSNVRSREKRVLQSILQREAYVSWHRGSYRIFIKICDSSLTEFIILSWAFFFCTGSCRGSSR